MFCPITSKDCSRDCLWYKVDHRQYSGKADTTQVEGCIVLLIYEELRNHSNQNSMQHKEMGEVKNNIVYSTLAVLGKSEGVKQLKKQLFPLLGEIHASSSKDN